jgi:hypothetical protein
MVAGTVYRPSGARQEGSVANRALVINVAVLTVLARPAAHSRRGAACECPRVLSVQTRSYLLDRDVLTVITSYCAMDYTGQRSRRYALSQNIHSSWVARPNAPNIWSQTGAGAASAT